MSPRRDVQTVASSRGPGESVVALLVVLGSIIVEVPATHDLATAGLRASRPANVSPSCKYVLTHTIF